MIKVKRTFRLRIDKQFQKFRPMNIVALDASRGASRCIYELTKRCPEQEAGDRRSYLLDAICKADPLEQEQKCEAVALRPVTFGPS